MRPITTGKTVQKNSRLKKPLQRRGNSVVFSKKNVIKNNDFSSKNMKKHEKYFKSKNDVKKLLGGYNQHKGIRGKDVSFFYS